MTLRAALCIGCLGACLVPISDKANAQDEPAAVLTATPPPSVSPFDPELLDRIRRAIADHTAQGDATSIDG